MPKQRNYGRIYFLGNPWPDGHAVTACAWTARVERGTGIWFDLHLETENYYAADKKSPDDDGVDEYEATSGWKSKILWCNYHSCILSSVTWKGQGQGFLVATKKKPLNLRAISGTTFRVDDPPVDFTLPRPFNIYLTGYDEVSQHRITFKREARKRTYSIDWRGRIALYYSGDEEFKYKFHATLSGVPFGGITEFPNGTERHDAELMVEPFVTHLPEWKSQTREDELRVVPA
jgi:hypothetical protein